jgi:hypothetical protein
VKQVAQNGMLEYGVVRCACHVGVSVSQGPVRAVARPLHGAATDRVFQALPWSSLSPGPTPAFSLRKVHFARSSCYQYPKGAWGSIPRCSTKETVFPLSPCPVGS